MDYRSFFKHGTPSGRGRKPKLHWRLRALLFASGLMLLGVVLARTQDPSIGFESPVSAAIQVVDHTEIALDGELIRLALPLPETNTAHRPSLAAPADDGEWTEVTIRSGDTLSDIFGRLGIRGQLHTIMNLPEASAALRKIHPGQRIGVRIVDGGLQALHYDPDDLNRLAVVRTDSGYAAQSTVRETEVRFAQAAGVIESSLFIAGQDAGLSDALIMEMAGIFGWDIDFALDIRRGDSFVLLYEELFRDGEKLRNGSILAAEFTNQGRTYRAIRYETPDGNRDYYDSNGRSMRKAFLRTPLEFSRVSSQFGMRKHPVHKTNRLHRGVDYAAPTGTPIRAAGDGRVTFRGVRGGYGNTVTIQHGPRYTTLYAHMSRFAPKVAAGTRVRQGQVIGYVGMTGTATGPHLHYEFHVDGTHRNPLTVKLPEAEPLPAALMADFRGQAEPLLTRIDLYSRIALARNDASR